MIEKRIEKPMGTADVLEATPVENIDWPEQSTTAESIEGQTGLLLTGEEIDQLKSRWDTIQTDFVDEPRPTVERADGLVAEVNNRIAQMLSERRALLQEEWVRGEDVSTEDLRIALQRYRSFFFHLLDL